MVRERKGRESGDDTKAGQTVSAPGTACGTDQSASNDAARAEAPPVDLAGRQPADGGRIQRSADGETDERLPAADHPRAGFNRPYAGGGQPDPTRLMEGSPSGGSSARDLDRELAHDLERLTAASASLASAKRWVAQYADEASALAAAAESRSVSDGATGGDLRAGAASESDVPEQPAPGQREGMRAAGKLKAAEDQAPEEAVQSRGGISRSGVQLASRTASPSAQDRGDRDESPGREDESVRHECTPPDLELDGEREPGYGRHVILDGQTSRQDGPHPPDRQRAEVSEAADEVVAPVRTRQQDSVKCPEGPDVSAGAASEDRVRRLEVELERAREELDRLRVSAAQGEKMHSALASRRRKLDERAAELRERVARAQQALDNRARKLRETLVKERERLKDYQVRLRQKAKELSEAAHAEEGDREGELAAEQARLETAWAELRARESDLEARRAELETTSRREFERRSTELEAAAETRLSGIGRADAARQEELDHREAALSRRESELGTSEGRLDLREADLTGREAALEKSQSSKEAELQERAEALAAEAVRAAEARQGELEGTVARRSADLDRERKAIVEREAAVSQRETEAEAVREAAEQGEDAVTRRTGGLDRRDEELARMSAALEVREQRLKEWQCRIENSETGMETERLQLEQQQRNQEQTEDRNLQAAAEAEAQFLEMRRGQESLRRKKELIESGVAEIESEAASQRSREQELRRREAEAATREAHLARERERHAHLEERAETLDRLEADLTVRQGDLDLREGALSDREASYEQEAKVLGESREEMEAIRSRLEVCSEEASGRLREADQRMQEADKRLSETSEVEERLAQRDSDLQSRQVELDRLDKTCGERGASLAAQQEDLSRRQESLHEMELALELDRKQSSELKAVLAQERSDLAAGQERLAAERSEIQAARAGLDEETASVARRGAAFEEQRSALEADRAKVERDLLATRDRERMLEEQRGALESEREGVEQERLGLSQQADETSAVRRQLESEAERLRIRESRLEEDLSRFEADRKALDAELAEARQQQLENERQREQHDEAGRQIAVDRERFDQERRSLEESERTFQAGLRRVEDNERDLVEREAKLAARSSQLEAYRQRLEEEYAELRKQREEFLSAGEQNGGATEQVAALLRQADGRHEELRKNEARLDAFEQALSARAAELGGAEEEVGRLREMQEQQTQASQKALEELEERRKDLEGEIASRHEEVVALRREAESEIAAEREALAQSRREFEEDMSTRREAAEAEGAALEGTEIEAMRRRVEAELADRLAEVAQKEEEVDRRCEARLEEVDRDVDHRLAVLEAEIRERHEQAEQENAARRESSEDDMARARSRLDDQIEELRRRQSALVEERAVLNERRAALEAQLRDLGVAGVEGLEASELPPAAVDPAIEAAQIAEEVDAGSEASAPAFRPWYTAAMGALMGLLAALMYLWSPSDEVTARGQLMLKPIESAGTLTAEEHLAVLVSPALLEEASAQVNADLLLLYREGRVRIRPSASGEAVELAASEPAGELGRSQAWIDGLARAYMVSLGEMEVSEAQRQKHVADLESRLDVSRGQREAAFEEMQQMKSALESDPRLGELEGSRREKDALSEGLAEALNEVHSAESALTRFEATLDRATPIVPSEAQLRASCDADAELAQAVRERGAKARTFHVVLVEAMTGSQTPLTTMQATLDGFLAEVRKWLSEQTDADIRRELEQVALDVEDYKGHITEFSDAWDDLAPKVVAWKSANPPEALIEYQNKAEELVRTLHKQSATALGSAGLKADAIGRGGAEMTQRRIIQNALMRQAHACDEARSEWIRAAWGIVPTNDPEVRALRNAVRDLTPRIEERRSYHRRKLVEHLEQVRTDERLAAHQQLRDSLAVATRRHQELSDAYLKVDSALSQYDEQLREELRRRRGEIQNRTDLIAEQDRAEAALVGQLERVRAARKITLAGSVEYQALAPILPARFDLDRRNGAIGLGGTVAVVFALIVWLRSRPGLVPWRPAA